MEKKRFIVPKPGDFVGISQYRPPLSYELKGKTLNLVMDDGYDYILNVLDKRLLKFGRAGQEGKESVYECLKADDDTFMLCFDESEGVGVTLVLDMEQGLVTAQRVCVGDNPRHPGLTSSLVVFGAIQREDGEASILRHGYTNGLVGRAIHWRFGRRELIHAYASERYCRLALPETEEARPEDWQAIEKLSGDEVYEEPADYIRIKKDVYAVIVNSSVRNRVCGVGGNMLFLMHLGRMYTVGRVFGKNAAGEKESYTFGACGRYEKQPTLLNGVTELAKPGQYEGMSQHKPPFCYEQVGRSFTLIMDDGYDYEVKFVSRTHLTWGFSDGEKREYAYECLKGDEDTYFVNFALSGEAFRSCETLILDTEQSLVTAMFSQVGQNPRYEKLPSTKITFGAIQRPDGTIPEIRHGFTTDLIGKAICWRYGTLTIVHVYSSERYYRLTFHRGELERMMREDPERFRGFQERQRQEDSASLYEDEGEFIKIKDGLYVFSALESLRAKQKGSGNSLFFLIDTKRVHDVGRSFGYNGDGEPENYTFGAFGEYYDANDLLSRDSTEYIR